uniref:hypothetical protein n=1 Tax=Ningiella ruwaisensis TaxID=2364274 RepID=UPI00109EFA16|nr:hypothetical protein [Ningiella ruwaisensis]
MFTLKKGMQLHPFSDQSGLSIYNPFTTEIITLRITLTQFESLLLDSGKACAEHAELHHVLNDLSEKGIIEASPSPARSS